MEKYKKMIIVNVVVFVLLGLLMSVFGIAGVGAVGVIIGAANIFIGLLALLFGRKKVFIQGCLLCGAVLLLIGFSLCSAFPLNFK
jgi:MFS family permease